MWYHVITISNKTGEEFVNLITDNKDEAIERARQEKYYIERDKTDYTVEIQLHDQRLDQENYSCTGYDTIEF